MVVKLGNHPDVSRGLSPHHEVLSAQSTSELHHKAELASALCSNRAVTSPSPHPPSLSAPSSPI